MHAKIISGGYGQNVCVGSKLIGMYAGLDQLYMIHARKVFDHFLERDVFLWNMMIQTYAHSGLSAEALGMWKDEMTSRVIHGHVMKCCFYFNVFVGNALVALYAKCQTMEACRHVFDEIPEKDVVNWNTIISGCANNDRFIEAIELFHTFLQDESFSAPDHATLVSILPVCAQVAEIRLGYWIHCYSIKIGLTSNTMVGSGLIAMYGNSGHLDYARQVFDEISERNIMVWTAMMRGYAGLLMEAVEFNKLMPTLPRKDVYGALVGASRMHNNIELAKVVVEKLFALDPDSGGRYVM
ncbi:hypothetical protein R6Q59_023687 [Mikania micrantha]